MKWLFITIWDKWMRNDDANWIDFCVLFERTLKSECQNVDADRHHGWLRFNDSDKSEFLIKKVWWNGKSGFLKKSSKLKIKIGEKHGIETQRSRIISQYPDYSHSKVLSSTITDSLRNCGFVSNCSLQNSQSWSCTFQHQTPNTKHIWFLWFTLIHSGLHPP
jgi:hypothetical protein